jgi:molybdenum cofactor biosynthesis enzyme
MVPLEKSVGAVSISVWRSPMLTPPGASYGNVGEKANTARRRRQGSSGCTYPFKLIKEGGIIRRRAPVAQLAGIMAAKRSPTSSSLPPSYHSVDIDFQLVTESTVKLPRRSTAQQDRCEMEAFCDHVTMTVTICAKPLTHMKSNIRLVHKNGKTLVDE